MERSPIHHLEFEDSNAFWSNSTGISEKVAKFGEVDTTALEAVAKHYIGQIGKLSDLQRIDSDSRQELGPV